MTTSEEVTRLLKELSAGKDEARDELMPLVYEELRALARQYMRKERQNHTLQTTALVHEAYVRLGGEGGLEWNDRVHFFRIVAKAMRQVLVDHARRKGSEKRGKGMKLEQLEENAAGALLDSSTNIIDLDGALDALAEQDRRMAQVVELRFFGGLSVEETARIMDVSPRTVKSEWRLARAWLKEHIG